MTYLFRHSGSAATAAFLLALPITVQADTPVPQPGISSRIDAIRQRGSLRVAVLNEYPWLKQTDGGKAPFEGPAWRLAEEYASRLGVKLETVSVSQDLKVPILSTGKVDITIAPLLETPARNKIVDFVLYSLSAQCLFGLADNPKVAAAVSIDDLNRSDVTVAYTIGTPQGVWVQGRLSQAVFLGVPVDPGSPDVSIKPVLSHQADVTTIDKFFFDGIAKKVPGLVTVPRGAACLASKEMSIPVGLGIDKHQPEFLTWLRAVAEEIKPQVVAAEARVEKAGS